MHGMPLSPGERQKEGILLLVLKRHSVFKSQGKNAKHVEWRTLSAQSFEYNWDQLCSTYHAHMDCGDAQPWAAAHNSHCLFPCVQPWLCFLRVHCTLCIDDTSVCTARHWKVILGGHICQKWGCARALPLCQGSLVQCEGCLVSRTRFTSPHL